MRIVVKTKETNMKKTLLETLKFTARLALLVGVPIIVKYATNLQGNWGLVVGAVIPVLLPIIDKYIHENDNIKANGILPF